jgi:hypothetical protein
MKDPEVLHDITLVIMPVLSQKSFAGYKTIKVVTHAFGVQNYSSN